MKSNKPVILLSILMSAVLMISGCDYDPSMLDTAGNKGQEGVEVVLTGTVIEDTAIVDAPHDDAEIVEILHEGDVVTITSEEANGYYPVEYDDSIQGYVPEIALDVQETLIEVTPSEENVLTATVIDNINIRRGPGQDYELIERIGPGAVLTIVGEEENGYYPVDYNGEIGYAHHNFIEINEQPQAVQTDSEAPVDGPITVDNNETFAEILTLTDPFDDRIAQFANSHIGDTIEFDGYMGDIAPHGTYTTRYDFLVCVGDSDDPAVGPNFHFTDFSYSDMHFDNNSPDDVYRNDEFRFTAEILSFNETTGLFELRPVSTVYRGS